MSPSRGAANSTLGRIDFVLAHARRTGTLHSVLALLEWDQQTLMPSGGGVHRAAQIEMLAGQVHEMKTNHAYRESLDALSTENLAEIASHEERANIAVLGRECQRLSRIPVSLVEQIARCSSESQQVWIEARKSRDYSLLLPSLRQMFRLKKSQADALGYESSPYDALLDEYEPQMTTAELEPVFGKLATELSKLVQKVCGAANAPGDEILRRKYPVERQKKFAAWAAEEIGFDFSRGRIDTTHHPFCTEVGPGDCRIATRYDEAFFPTAFFGTLHEAGHGLYEQGLRSDCYGLPSGTFCSLGIHESQSRLWENLVGRRSSFWRYCFPKAVEFFPEILSGSDHDEFVRSVNRVQPSLIRVEADEVTYNLHILVRFRLEKSIMEGSLEVADLPDAWNDQYESLLGIRPLHDGDGVLQDIHWPAGLVGYFPTYSLGNIYAAQLVEAAQPETGNLDELNSSGDFRPLREWMNRHVHHHGQVLRPSELLKSATGQSVSSGALLGHLTNKCNEVYCL